MRHCHTHGEEELLYLWEVTMKRRPVCIVCLMLMLVLVILNRIGIPLLPEPPGNEAADRIIDSDSAKDARVTVIGKVRSSEERDDFTDCILTKTFLLKSGRQYRIGDVRLYLIKPKLYPAGCTIRATGTLAAMPSASNPGQFDSDLYYRIQKIRYRMKKASAKVVDPSYNYFREALADLQRKLRRRITQVFPKREAGILAAMLIGDKSMIGEEDRTLWQTSGVIHMLAISGLHLTILGMGLYQFLKKVHIPEIPSVICSVFFLLLYSIFTGLAVSTLRAFLMFALLLSARLFGRTYDPPTALSIAAILILLENPYYLFYSGFQLSFSAVFFCMLFGRRSKLMMSLMLSLGMLPLILNSFYEIPFYSIPVNLITVPLLPLILGSGIIGTLFGGFAVCPAVFLLRMLNFLFRFTGKLPCASVIAGKPDFFCIFLFYLLYSIWAWYMKKYKAYKRKMLFLLFIPCLIGILVIHPEKRLRLTFLDVGQGDSCLIETPLRRNILVDGGSSTVQDVGTYRILPALKAEGVRQIDYLIVTHMDSDHISGIEEILEDCASKGTALKIRTVVLPYLKEYGDAYQKMIRLAKKAGGRVLYVSEGDRIALDRCELTFLNPDPAKEETPVDENGQCVVFHFRYRSFDALFTGDVSGEGEQNVLQEWGKYQKRRKAPVRCEVLKTAHHGSSYSTPKKFLDEVQPEVSVISVGKENRYGHPSPDLLKRLKKAGTKILRTDEAGAVTVDTNGKKFRVSTYR